MKRLFCLVFALAGISFCLFAQNLSESDEILFNSAIDLFDKGEPDKAIRIYKDLMKKYPEDYNIRFELGYSYATIGENEKAIEILSALENNENATDGVFTTIAVCQNNCGKQDEALNTLKLGAEKFPNSGRIYFNLGEFYLNRQDLKNASDCYLKGIQVEPDYISNYYKAAFYTSSVDEKIASLMFGEIYCLRDPTSQRYREMSNYLYMSTALCFRMVADDSRKMTESPFSFVKIFRDFQVSDEWLSLLKDSGFLGIGNLAALRFKFLESVVDDGNIKNMPALIQYQKKIIDAGHWDAYNMWLFCAGNEKEFDMWLKNHYSETEAFVEWFNNNNFQLGGQL